MSRRAEFCIFPLQRVLDVFAKKQFDSPSIQRLPLTGQPMYDAWVDAQKNEVVFQLYINEQDDGGSEQP